MIKQLSATATKRHYSFVDRSSKRNHLKWINKLNSALREKFIFVTLVHWNSLCNKHIYFKQWPFPIRSTFASVLHFKFQLPFSMFSGVPRQEITLGCIIWGHKFARTPLKKGARAISVLNCHKLPIGVQSGLFWESWPSAFTVSAPKRLYSVKYEVYLSVSSRGVR